MQWLKRVPKIQNSTNDNGYYSSFSLFRNAGDLYFIYNDNNQNTELDIDNTQDLKPIFNGRRNMLAMTKVDTSGLVSRDRINLSETNYLLYAKKSLQISEQNMYLLSELGRKAKIISLTF